MDFCRVNEIILSTKKYFFDRKNVLVTLKSKDNFVTSIDKKIEDYLKDEFSKLDDEISFVLEEGEHEFSSKYLVIDPLDGTSNFIMDLACSGVSVAYVENGNIKYAALFNPYNDEFLYDIDNKVYLNGKLIEKKINNKNLSEGIIDLGTSPYNKSSSKNLFSLAENIYLNSIDLRRSGSTAVNLINVISGKILGFCEDNLSIWDFLAGYKMLKDLDMYASNFKGEDISLTKEKDSFICSSSKICYEELLKLIGEYYG